MKHIFIAIGQTHLNNFETLLNDNIASIGERILVVDNTIIYNEALWPTVIKATISFNNTASSSVQQLVSISNKAKAYATIIKSLKKYKNESTVIYLAYIEDILSNYMFFSFSDKAKIVIVEDGTLNYYNHSLANVSALKFRLKQTIAKLRGIPFKKYVGHSSGAGYAHVIAQYLTFPDQAFVAEKVKQFPVETTSVDNTVDELYIIGQEGFCNLIGQDVFMTALKDFFEMLKKQPFYNTITTIHYKPHRNGVRLTQEFLSGYFPGKKVRLVTTSKTAEDLFFEELPCSFVTSFNSSTLINIYARLSKEDRAKIEFSVYPIQDNELIHVFKKLNFNFIKPLN